MGLFCRKETGIYYLKIKIYVDGINKYKKISLGTKNRYVAEQIYNAYLLDTIKDKITKNNDFKAMESSSNYENESISTKKEKPVKTA